MIPTSTSSKSSLLSLIEKPGVLRFCLDRECKTGYTKRSRKFYAELNDTKLQFELENFEEVSLSSCIIMVLVSIVQALISFDEKVWKCNSIDLYSS